MTVGTKIVEEQDALVAFAGGEDGEASCLIAANLSSAFDGCKRLLDGFVRCLVPELGLVPWLLLFSLIRCFF